MKWMTSVLGRLPTVRQVLPVFSLALLIFSAWTILRFFWELSSWLYFLTVQEIGMVLAYSMTANLLESLLVVTGLACLAAIVPGKWFREAFVPVGSMFVILGLGYLMYFIFQFQSRQDYPSDVIRALPVVAGGIASLAFLFGHLPFTRRILEALSDRSTVFLYPLVPLGLISVIMVLVQNLL